MKLNELIERQNGIVKEMLMAAEASPADVKAHLMQEALIERQVAYMLAEYNKLIGEHSELKSKYAEILGEVETLRREPCGDAISRRKAICAVSACDGMSAQIEALEELPSVNPEATVKEFADKCRECGAKYGRLLKERSNKP